MFRIIIAIFASGLVGYMGGFHKGYEEHAAMIVKLLDGEEDESEDSE